MSMQYRISGRVASGISTKLLISKFNPVQSIRLNQFQPDLKKAFLIKNISTSHNPYK